MLILLIKFCQLYLPFVSPLGHFIVSPSPFPLCCSVFCCQETWAPDFLVYRSAHWICLLAHWLPYQRLTNCHTEWGCVSTCSERERKPLCGQHETCPHRMTHYTKLLMRPFKQLVQALVRLMDAFNKKPALEWHCSAAHTLKMLLRWTP